MGYYTDYNLTIPGGTDPDVVAVFRANYSEAEKALDERGKCQESVKWYTHAEDLTEFSKSFPTLLFVLHCVGEDGREWKVYCKNGKSWEVTGQIVFQEFQEDFLK